MTYSKTFFILTLFIGLMQTLIHESPAEACQSCDSGSQLDVTPENKRETLLVVNQSIHAVTDLISLIDRGTTKDWKYFETAVQELDMRIQFLSHQPASNAFRNSLRLEAKHRFRKERGKCIYHGLECRECGTGDHTSYSWHYRCWDKCLMTKEGIQCCLIWGTFFCAGVQCYPLQWTLSLCNPYAWSCKESQVDTNELKNWATQLKTFLGEFKSYLETSETPLEVPHEHPTEYRARVAPAPSQMSMGLTPSAPELTADPEK